jgi:pantoate--beta-alanine ligase
MLAAQTAASARDLLAGLPRPLGFVPTMGALHAGHAALVEAARANCASVAASIFVNPLQFGPNEDFERYPRAFDADRALLEAAGVDVLFAPTVQEMYPPGFSTRVDPGAIGARYEGAQRAGHFVGVATVVTKLLDVVRPDVLYVGQKDAQQAAVLRHVVRDLAHDVRVETLPTVRESDGLARSSRNAYLSEREREAAPRLHRALCAVSDAFADGESKERATRRAREMLGASAQWDYVDVVHGDTFEPLERNAPRALVVGAARFGSTRLLDNVWVRQ